MMMLRGLFARSAQVRAAQPASVRPAPALVAQRGSVGAGAAERRRVIARAPPSPDASSGRAPAASSLVVNKFERLDIKIDGKFNDVDSKFNTVNSKLNDQDKKITNVETSITLLQSDLKTSVTLLQSDFKTRFLVLQVTLVATTVMVLSVAGPDSPAGRLLAPFLKLPK